MWPGVERRQDRPCPSPFKCGRSQAHKEPRETMSESFQVWPQSGPQEKNIDSEWPRSAAGGAAEHQMMRAAPALARRHAGRREATQLAVHFDCTWTNCVRLSIR
jgi:hypothetical protein